MILLKNTVTILLVLVTLSSYSQAETSFPKERWKTNANIDLNSQLCNNWVYFASGGKDRIEGYEIPTVEVNLFDRGIGSDKEYSKIEQQILSSIKIRKVKPVDFNTAGLVVIKDGKVAYEFYDKTAYRQDSKHYVWSATKSVTSTLLGRAIHDGVSYNGKRVEEETKLAEFFSYRSIHPDDINSDLEKLYNQIRLIDLAEMSANFEWQEAYEKGIVTSSVLPMLYLDGNNNIPLYALKAPMRPEGPGKMFVYSDGNANILMAVLRKIYADNYRTMPWDILFEPLNMQHKPIFETDQAGNFIASTHLFMTPRDMARLGYLFLHDGVWDGKRLLSKDWIKKSVQISPAVDTVYTPRYRVVRHGIWSARSFWLNKAAKQYGPEFPNSPADMYFATGHYGQLIIIIPSENMVIARTGDDKEYWDKIDKFVNGAIRCINKKELPKLDTISADELPDDNPNEKVEESTFEIIEYGSSSGLLNQLLAKEVCSCLFNQNIAKHFGSEEGLNICLNSSNLPIPVAIIKQLVDIDVDLNKGTVSSRLKSLAKSVTKEKNSAFSVAQYNLKEPQYGCMLLSRK